MVAGKVKAAMGFQKSPITPKQDTPRSFSTPSSHKAKAAAASQPSQHKSGAMFSRSFGVYFPRSSAQVQPRPPDVTELLRLVEELQEKESRLRTELLEHKILKETVAIVPFLEKEISSKTDELDRARQRIQALEVENQSLQLEVERLKSKIREDEVEEKEREMESKIEAMQGEIEELRTAITAHSRGHSKRQLCSGTAEVDECSSSQRFHVSIEASSRFNMHRSWSTNSKSSDIASNQEILKPEASDPKGEEGELEQTQQDAAESAISIIKSRTPRVPKPPPRPSTPSISSSTSSTSSEADTTKKSRGPRLTELPPIPPPCSPRESVQGGVRRPPPPPPPPPPPAKGLKSAPTKVRRVPEVAEFYHSLMRRDSRRESGSGVPEAPVATNAKNMIGEIENRSAYLLAIKTEVETQGDFIRFLIKEVQGAAFTNIEDVVAFVKWLDEELSFLVDERAVLKHFDWPEHKADAMREAAFGYSDLRKLESEAAASFRDDLRQPCASALKKMQALLEKLEHGVYNLARVREAAMKRYKGFQIPWEWMQETGYVSQIKLASVKLALKYMKRVSAELQAVGGGPEQEELMLQGVRFAFRVHQFAGGFDMETMRAFQELREKARSCQMQRQI